jgi:hypothetical protein
MTSPVVEFQASAGDECQWSVAIPKASRFTFQIERLDQQADDWGEMRHQGRKDWSGWREPIAHGSRQLI